METRFKTAGKTSKAWGQDWFTVFSEPAIHAGGVYLIFM